MQENHGCHCVQISCGSFRYCCCTVFIWHKLDLRNALRVLECWSSIKPTLSLPPPPPRLRPNDYPFWRISVFPFLSFSFIQFQKLTPLVSRWGLLPSLLYYFNFQKPCAHILLPSLLPDCAGSTCGLVLRPWSSDSTLGGLLEVRGEEKSESLS